VLFTKPHGQNDIPEDGSEDAGMKKNVAMHMHK
jgi:hypothetical protein